MADDNEESIFAKAGFTLPKAAAPASVAATKSARTEPKAEPSIFEAAGFKLPMAAAKEPAPALASNIPTPEKFAADFEKYGAKDAPGLVDRAVEAVGSTAKAGASHVWNDTLENLAAGWQRTKEGLSEIRAGNLGPHADGQAPASTVTNLLGETRSVPGLTQYAPGGVLKTLGGIGSAVTSPVSGSVNALISRPVTELTGNPEIGDRAGFVANALLPKVLAGKAANAVAPSTKATNALVKMVGPENVPEVVARLRENPRLALADVSDPVRVATQGLVDPSQPAVQKLVADRVKERAMGRNDVANSAYTEAMGPAPDIGVMVEGLRKRAEAAGTPTAIARSALDKIMGKSEDPYSVLQKTLKDRSEAAQPLYEKALSRPVAWDERLQQFIDDPVVKSGLAKGVRIQRLESLAEGKPFNPNDYAIKSFNEAGDPILGETPNMRTLNVVKKGLDSMVEDAKDPITGRLSEEGRALEKVRGAYLSHLDSINKDYKAARQAWAGPSQAQDAFNRGLNIFQNRAGASGVNSTPEALSTWLKGASDAEREAAKQGARAAFEQQMKAGSDPAAKSATLVNKEVNHDKLTALFGKEQADKLVDHLNFKFEDPIGRAFDEGFDVLKNRSGQSGFADRPAALEDWMKTATPEQAVAKRLGVRADIDQKLNGVKNGGLAGQTITKIPYNQEKLRTLFGEGEANRLIRVMRDAEDQANTNAKLIGNSKTAETLAGKQALEVRKVGGGNPLQYVAPVAAEMLGQGAGLPGVGFAASLAGKGLHMIGQKAGQMQDIARNYHFAHNALSAGPAREQTINALLSHPKVVRQLKKSANALTVP